MPCTSSLPNRLSHTPAIRAVGATGDLDQAVHLVREMVPDAVLYDPHTVPGDVPPAMAQLGAAGRPVVVLTSSLRDGATTQPAILPTLHRDRRSRRQLAV